ncbi:MAG: AEC family transporter [bacterium]
MHIQVVLSQMIQLFMLLGIGYLLAKVRIMDEAFSAKLTGFVLDVTIPCLLIGSALSITSYQSAAIVAYVFGIAFALFLVMPVIGYVMAKLLRVPREELGLYIFMSEFSNIGFIGFPVMNAIFGVEAVFYTTIFNMVFNLFVYTVGIMMIQFGTKQSGKIELKRIVTPSMVACILSLMIYLAHIHLPSVFTNTFTSVGSMTTPLAMMIIGATLATIPVREVFTEVRIYPYTLMKQIILPILAYLIISRLITDPLILGVTLICIAMPVGTSAVLFAKRYGGNQQLAAKTIFMTTLLSLATIPVIVYLFL